MFSLPTIGNRQKPAVLTHILAWTVYITFIYLANVLANPQVRLHKTVLFLLPFIIVFYGSIYLLRITADKPVTRISIAIIVLFLLMVAVGHSYMYLLMPELGVELYTKAELVDFFKGAVLGFLQYFAYALIYHYVERNIDKERQVRDLNELTLQKELENARLNERELKAAKEKLQLESAYLRSQINPHFLHNTLNVLYAQAQLCSPPLAHNIAQLSRMMRYSMENLDEQPGKVPVRLELENLQLLIEINRLRFEKTKKVELEIDGDPGNQLVPPLSMITVVENAFKYGDLKDPLYPISVKVKLRPHEVHFTCTNKKGRRLAELTSNKIGITNLKRRLDATFKDRYVMKTSTDDNLYKVELIIYN